MADFLSRFTKRCRAEKSNEAGRQEQNSGNISAAVAAYKAATKIDPGWFVPYYNLGLVYKYQFDWPQSFYWSERATLLNAKDDATWWNFGIAATALQRWQVARKAWKEFGIPVPAGEGPLDFPCGTSPIRLNPNGIAEVVWCHRIDPARAVIQNIPLLDSGYRWRDIVLNDGAGTGTRMLGDKEVPVLDCLGLIESSPFETFVTDVQADDFEMGLQILEELLKGRDIEMENWTSKI